MYSKWLLKSIFLFVSNAFIHLEEIVVNQKLTNIKLYKEMISPLKCRMQHHAVAVVIKVMTFFQIHLKAARSEDMCPVKSLYKYVQTFGHKSGPLFQFMGGEPVPYAFVAKHLQNIISFIGLNPALYNFQNRGSHSCGTIRLFWKIHSKWADRNQMQFVDTFGCQTLHFNSIIAKCKYFG